MSRQGNSYKAGLGWIGVGLRGPLHDRSNARSSSHPSIIALGCLYGEIERGKGQGHNAKVNSKPKGKCVPQVNKGQEVEELGNTASATKASLRQCARSIPLTTTC